MTRRYTRDLLEEAARKTNTYDDAVRWCGGTPTAGSRRYLRQKMAAAGVDTSHFTKKWVRYSDEALRESVAASTSVKEVLQRLGVSPVGGSHTHFSRRIAALDIDTTHFAKRRGRIEVPHGGLLVLGSPQDGRIHHARLRRELLRLGVPERCARCGTGTMWNGRPLRLEVDHKNADWWDNRPENLRFLCPNCHSVTDTYRGRKRTTG
ncbi:HNH endonuclease [Streptomyces sp. CB01580]|uniref:HNH endonuclease n=1 Tax=Streptomyces sp. CB01580 TaxID=1703933 RepID=UPI0009A0C3EE|nr:HNH endonuclease [Streptomyces sp. CB01580]